MALIGSLSGRRLKAVKELRGDGGRLFDVDSQRKIALNKTAFLIAQLLLRGRDRSEIVGELRRRYRGARRKLVEEDIDGVVRLLDDFVGQGSVGEPSAYSLHPYRWNEPLEMPLTVYWEVTQKCNLRCIHCYTASGKRRRDELGTDECLQLIDELGKGGVCEMVIGGGEPFARKDMADLVAAMHRADMAVSLVSNGTLLRWDLVRRLRDVGLSHMAVSLDGAVPATHDAFRGRDGAFRKAVEGIGLLRRAGFTVTIQTVITRLNMDSLPEIAGLAHELGARSWYTIALNPLTRVAGTRDLMLGPEEVGVAAARMQQIAQQYAGRMTVDPSYPLSFTLGRAYAPADKPCRMLGCGPGIETAGLTADGRLLTCSFIRGEAWTSKSVREESFTRQWQTSPIFDAFRSLSSAQLTSCKTCSLLFDECWGGCRARAFVASGDFYARDPFCHLRFPDGAPAAGS